MIKTKTTAVVKFLSFLPNNFKALFSLAFAGFLSVNHKVKSAFSWLRFTVALIAILIFLFIHPSIGAQTKVTEAVLPVIEPGFVTISDNVTATQIPTLSAPNGGYGYISTYFSVRHQGIDIPSPYGSFVKPVADGLVTFAGWSTLGYGKLVTIEHEGGVSSLYAHLSAVNVKVGQRVTVNEVIGNIGTTGVATGAHLHLEIFFNGVPIDPLTFISQEKLLQGI